MPPTLANLIWVMPAEGSELILWYQFLAAMGITLAVFLFSGSPVYDSGRLKNTAEIPEAAEKPIIVFSSAFSAPLR